MRFQDYQSLFQLAAALSTGISGFLTFWDDPATQEAKKVALLHGKAKRFRHRFEQEFSTAEIKDLNILIDEISDLEINTIADGGSHSIFHIVRFVFVIFCIFSIYLLFISSDNKLQSNIMEPWIIFITYILVLATPAVIILSALYNILYLNRHGKSPRVRLDGKYVEMVSRFMKSRANGRN